MVTVAREQGYSVEVYTRPTRAESKPIPYAICQGCQGSVLSSVYHDSNQATWHEECYEGVDGEGEGEGSGEDSEGVEIVGVDSE